MKLTQNTSNWLLGGVVLAMVSLAVAADPPAKVTRAKPPNWNEKQAVVDVFFTDARSELSGKREGWILPGGPASGNSVAAAGPTTGPAPEAGGPAMVSAGPSKWSALIDAGTLEAEVRANVNPLAGKIKNASEFKGGGAKDCRSYFTAVAFAFAVINDYDGEVRWKNQALGARELFGRAANNCKVGTDTAFAESKLRVGDLQAIIGGDTIAAPKDADPTTPWNKLVARAPLMARLEIAFNDRVAKWTGSEGDFQKNADACAREAQIIAAIGEAIQRDGYQFVDDSTYKGFAVEMKKAGMEISEAAKAKNYAAARAAAGNMNKSCANCHSGFRS